MNEISNKMCRMCLQNNGEVYLFKEEPVKTESYHHKFSSCTSIKISAKDPMPKLLCTICSNRLNDAFILRQLAHESDAILKKRYNFINEIKTEKDDFDCNDGGSFKSEESEVENLSMPAKLSRKINRSKVTNVFAIELSQEHHTKIRKKSNDNASLKDGSKAKTLIKKEVKVDVVQTIKDTDGVSEKKLYKRKSITLSQLKDKCIKNKMKIQDNKIKNIKRNNPVICEECGRKCKTIKILRVHKRVHRDDKPYHCDFCDWKFTWKGNRDMHVSTVHLQNKKYQCELCPKQFAYHKNLIEHRRIHTGEKPHVCDKCDRSFSRRFAMIRHRLTHTQARPYGCIHCHKTYTQCNDLKAHVKKSHVGTPTKTLSDYCLKLN